MKLAAMSPTMPEISLKEILLKPRRGHVTGGRLKVPELLQKTVKGEARARTLNFLISSSQSKPLILTVFWSIEY